MESGCLSNSQPSVMMDMSSPDDDDVNMVHMNLLNHSMKEEWSDEYMKPKWNITTRRERIWPLLRLVAYGAAAILIIATFFLAVYDNRAISSIDALQTEIEKLNMTLTQRLDTHFKDTNAIHNTLNNTIHNKHSDQVRASKEIVGEFKTKLAQLQTTLVSLSHADDQEIKDTLADICESMSQMSSNVQNDKRGLDDQVKDLRSTIQSLQSRLSDIDKAYW